MRASTKARAEGKLREVEGALEDAVGAAARDRDRVEGMLGKQLPKVQGAPGRVKKVAKT
jgi:uncharacterized protein YjbJ (UPF0337 family)